MKRALAVLAGFTILTLMFAHPLLAQEKYPVWDLKHRTQFSASSAYIAYKAYGETGDPWRGVDLAGAVTYSIHPALSVFTIYGHGFPLESADGHENQVRLAANLLLYPGADSPPTNWSLFIGAGGLWRGTNTVDGWSGIETHATLSAGLNDWLAAFGSYFHGFASRPELYSDLDFMRLGLAARLGR